MDDVQDENPQDACPPARKAWAKPVVILSEYGVRDTSKSFAKYSEVHGGTKGGASSTFAGSVS